MATTLYDKIGGDMTLRLVIPIFYSNVLSDPDMQRRLLLAECHLLYLFLLLLGFCISSYRFRLQNNFYFSIETEVSRVLTPAFNRRATE